MFRLLQAVARVRKSARDGPPTRSLVGRDTPRSGPKTKLIFYINFPQQWQLSFFIINYFFNYFFLQILSTHGVCVRDCKAVRSPSLGGGLDHRPARRRPRWNRLGISPFRSWRRRYRASPPRCRLVPKPSWRRRLFPRSWWLGWWGRDCWIVCSSRGWAMFARTARFSMEFRGGGLGCCWLTAVSCRCRDQAQNERQSATERLVGPSTVLTGWREQKIF